MPVSPFSLAGPAMYALGYNPIPIMPGDKKPGIMIDGAWRLFRGWNQYCVSRPTQFSIDQWTEWPMAGVGAACGHGLICIDIDLEEAMGPLLEILPLSNVQKKGKKGVSLFYRGNTELIRSKNFRTPPPDKVGLVDLLAEGKQTVLPPSIHPDTQEAYVWLTPNTLLNTPLEELTELDDDIADQVADVLREFGYDPDRDRVVERVAAGDNPETGSMSSERSIYRQANDDAIANLHAWVPKLHLYKWRQKPGGFEAVAHWRQSGSGRALEMRKRNLSIVRNGIEDFGTGDKFTSIDLVMIARGCDKSVALNWLLEQLPQAVPLILLRK